MEKDALTTSIYSIKRTQQEELNARYAREKLEQRKVAAEEAKLDRSELTYQTIEKRDLDDEQWKDYGTQSDHVTKYIETIKTKAELALLLSSGKQ